MAEEEETALEGLDGDGDGDELDPLAEEMLRMMEEEGDDDDSGSQEDVDRMMEQEMLKAMEGEGGDGGLLPVGGGLGDLDLGGSIGGDVVAGGGISPSVGRLMDIPLLVTIELGAAEKTLEQVMELGEQSLIELNKTHGDPVDVKVNGQLFARGEVVTVAENFGVRITELLPGGLRM